MREFEEFLFPRDLQRTPSAINNVLLVGSCLAESYRTDFMFRKHGIRFDFLLFNNVHELPAQPPLPIASYDFQFLQIPLRSILSDRVVRYGDFCGPLNESLRQAAFVNLRMMLEAGLAYNREAGLLTMVSTFIVPQRPIRRALRGRQGASDLTKLIRDLNEAIFEICEARSDVFVADADEIASSYGKGAFLDDWWHTFSHAAAMPHNWEEGTEAPFHLNAAPPRADSLHPIREHGFYQLVWRQLEAIYRTARQIDQVKLVIFDLDNTLWRGRLADHYGDGMDWPTADGWVEGLTEAVHHLRARGILVALCSRNDAAVVEARWERASPRGLLSLDDFIVRKIDYRSKADNIADILADVSVTAKSAVFVDDNPVERDEVSARFPAMRVIGDNQFQTRRLLLWAPETQVAILSGESARREQMVKQQIVREADRQAMGRDEFLHSLRCEVEIFEVADQQNPSFGRILELINKTNQFNTTGRRWTNGELLSLLDRGGRVFAFRVKDRFVDYGLVGVVLVEGSAVLQYVMSCRVLGMDIETSALSLVLACVADSGGAVTASTVDTGLNMVSRDIYQRAGFQEAQAGLFHRTVPEEATIAAHLLVRAPAASRALDRAVAG